MTNLNTISLAVVDDNEPERIRIGVFTLETRNDRSTS